MVFIPSIKPSGSTTWASLFVQLYSGGASKGSQVVFYFFFFWMFCTLIKIFFFSDRSEKVGGEIFVEKARGPLPFPLVSIITASIIIIITT